MTRIEIHPQSTYEQYAIALLRIVTAFLFIQHGTAKLFGFPRVAMFDHLQLLSVPGFAGGLVRALSAEGPVARPTASLLECDAILHDRVVLRGWGGHALAHRLELAYAIRVRLATFAPTSLPEQKYQVTAQRLHNG